RGKEERPIRELLLKIVAQHPHEVLGLPRAGLQRNQDFSGGVRDGRRARIRQIDTAARYPYVVQQHIYAIRWKHAPDLRIHTSEILLRILDAEARGGLNLK